MNTKHTFAALAFALAMVAGNAQAITTEEIQEAMQDYAAEMPELSYQPEAIDCKIAKKLAQEGSLQAMDAYTDVREHPASMSILAEGGTISLVMDFDFRGNVEKYLKSEKGFDEVMATYKGFYLQGVWGGASYKQKVAKPTLKDKRNHAKAIGKVVEQKCEGYKENGDLKKPIALFKVATGEF